MAYDARERHRRSTRLPGYDYAQSGAYFVTICTQERVCSFGDVAEGEMRLNTLGQIVQGCWNDLPIHYPHVELDEFVVMPNHEHGIIVLTDDIVVGAGLRPAPTEIMKRKRHGLPEIVRAVKSFSARRINALRNSANAPVWQRGYYEHVIRNGRDLERIRQYIVNNSGNWAKDEYYPEVGGGPALRTPSETRPYAGGG